MAAEEHLCKQDIDGEPGVAAHKRRHQHHLVPVPLVFQGPGCHHSRHRAPKAQEHGDEGLPRQPQTAHHVFHYIGHPGHIPGIFQETQCQKQDQDIGQEGDNGPHAPQDPVDDQGFQGIADGPGGEQPFQAVPEPADEVFHIAFQHIPYGEGQEEHHPHDQQEHRDGQNLVGHDGVNAVGQPQTRSVSTLSSRSVILSLSSLWSSTSWIISSMKSYFSRMIWVS